MAEILTEGGFNNNYVILIENNFLKRYRKRSLKKKLERGVKQMTLTTDLLQRPFKRVYQMTEFEREAFRQRISKELEELREISLVLQENIGKSCPSSAHLHRQRMKAFELEKGLRKRLKQVEVNRHLQMLSLNLKEMKRFKKALHHRRIHQINSLHIEKTLFFLENKLQDEIYREECGLNEGFKSFPMTSLEIKVLLETIQVQKRIKIDNKLK